MRQVGNVEIPQKAFMSVLKLDERVFSWQGKRDFPISILI